MNDDKGQSIHQYTKHSFKANQEENSYTIEKAACRSKASQPLQKQPNVVLNKNLVSSNQLDIAKDKCFSKNTKEPFSITNIPYEVDLKSDLQPTTALAYSSYDFEREHGKRGRGYQQQKIDLRFNKSSSTQNSNSFFKAQNSCSEISAGDYKSKASLSALNLSENSLNAFSFNPTGHQTTIAKRSASFDFASRPRERKFQSESFFQHKNSSAATTKYFNESHSSSTLGLAAPTQQKGHQIFFSNKHRSLRGEKGSQLVLSKGFCQNELDASSRHHYDLSHDVRDTSLDSDSVTKHMWDSNKKRIILSPREALTKWFSETERGTKNENQHQSGDQDNEYFSHAKTSNPLCEKNVILQHNMPRLNNSVPADTPNLRMLTRQLSFKSVKDVVRKSSNERANVRTSCGDHTTSLNNQLASKVVSNNFNSSVNSQPPKEHYVKIPRLQLSELSINTRNEISSAAVMHEKNIIIDQATSPSVEHSCNAAFGTQNVSNKEPPNLSEKQKCASPSSVDKTDSFVEQSSSLLSNNMNQKTVCTKGDRNTPILPTTQPAITPTIVATNPLKTETTATSTMTSPVVVVPLATALATNKDLTPNNSLLQLSSPHVSSTEKLNGGSLLVEDVVPSPAIEPLPSPFFPENNSTLILDHNTLPPSSMSLSERKPIVAHLQNEGKSKKYLHFTDVNEFNFTNSPELFSSKKHVHDDNTSNIPTSLELNKCTTDFNDLLTFEINVNSNNSLTEYLNNPTTTTTETLQCYDNTNYLCKEPKELCKTVNPSLQNESRLSNDATSNSDNDDDDNRPFSAVLLEDYKIQPIMYLPLTEKNGEQELHLNLYKVKKDCYKNSIYDETIPLLSRDELGLVADERNIYCKDPISNSRHTIIEMVPTTRMACNCKIDYQQNQGHSADSSQSLLFNKVPIVSASPVSIRNTNSGISTGNFESGGKQNDTRSNKRQSIDSKESNASHGNQEPVDFSQLGTRFIKDVPVCHGIPTAIINRKFPLIIFFAWIIVMSFVMLAAEKYFDWYIVNDVIELPSGINATLDLKNCVTSFTRAKGSRSHVMVRAWMARNEEFDWVGDVSALKTPYRWKTPTEWFTSLKIRRYNLYFQCVVRFHLAENFRFDRLLVSYEPDISYVDIDSTVDIQANSIILDAYHAFVRLKSLEAKKIQIHLGDGNLKFALDGNPDKYDYSSKDSIIINSRMAPVTLESSIPVDITMTNDVAARALLRGEGISITENTGDRMTAVVYSSDFSSFYAVYNSISLQTLGDEAPLYLTARVAGKDSSSLKLSTWAGVEQIETPHFLPASLHRVKSIRRWVDEAPSAPWTAIAYLSGEYVPRGFWKFLSSSAYLGNNNWFVLFSGGMLNPRKIQLQLHMMGLYCRTDVNMASQKDLGYILTDLDKEGSAKHRELLSLTKRPTTLRRLLFNEDESDGGRNRYDHSIEPIIYSNSLQQKFSKDWRRNYTIKIENNARHFQNYKIKKLQPSLMGNLTQQRYLLDNNKATHTPSKTTSVYYKEDISDDVTTMSSFQNPILPVSVSLLTSQMTPMVLPENYSPLFSKNRWNEHRMLGKLRQQQISANAVLFGDIDMNDNESRSSSQTTGETATVYLNNNSYNNQVKAFNDGSSTLHVRPSKRRLQQQRLELEEDDEQSGDANNAEQKEQALPNYPGMDIGATLPFSTCQTQILENMFVVFWKTFTDIQAAYVHPVWDDFKTGNEWIFDVQNDAVVKRLRSWTDTWLFTIAICINIISSAAIAYGGTVILQRVLNVIFCTNLLTDDPLVDNVSHRLDNEVTKRPAESWKPQVSRLYINAKTEGFIIRWANASFGLNLSRLCLRIAPVEYSISRNIHQGLSITNDIFIYFPPDSINAVDTESGTQSEIKVPLTYPSRTWPQKLNTDQSWDLSHKIKYRFKLLALNSVGRIIAQSSWSPETIIGEYTDVTDIAFWLCRKFFPSRYSSLHNFLSKHVRQSCPFKLPITMQDVSIEILTGYTETLQIQKTDSLPLIPAEAQLHSGLHDDSLDENDNYKKDLRTRLDMENNKMKQRLSTTGQPGCCSSALPDEKECLLKNHKQASSVGILETPSLSKDSGRNIELRSKDFQGGNSMARTLEALSLVLTVFLGGKNDVARQTQQSSGRKVWDRVFIGGRPFTVQNTRHRFVSLKTPSKLRLEHDRESQKVVSLEVSNYKTGSLIAFGSVSIEKIQQHLLSGTTLTDSKPLYLTIDLDSASGAKPWGRILCCLDASGLHPYVRHRDIEMRELTPQTVARAEFKRRFTTMAPIKNLSIENIANIATGFTTNRSTTKNNVVDFATAFQSEAYQRPKFIRDTPAKKILLGTDMIVQWEWNTPKKPDNIYFHLMDHTTNKYILSMHFGRAIPNTGSYSWPVEVNFELDKNYRVVYVVMTTEYYTGKSLLPVICQSNAFFIINTLPLCELELAYAASCRSIGIEMEHMSQQALAQRGIAVIEKNIRICPDLRRPLPFEPSSECVYCPGQCIISNTSKLVSLRDQSDFTNNSEQPGHKTSTVSSNIHQVNVYKSINRRIKVVENCVLDESSYWWIRSPDLLLASQKVYYGKTLAYILYTLLNLLQCRCSRRASRYMILEETETEFQFRRFCYYKLWPAALLTAFSSVSMMIFQIYPVTMCLLISVYNYLLTDFANYPHQDINSKFMSDIAFTRSFTFFLSLPFPIPHILLVILTDAFIHIITILFSRNFRYDCSKFLRITCARFVDDTQRFHTFVIMWMASSFLLWFFIGVLINSDTFLPYAVMLGSIIFVVYTLWNNYASSRELVSHFIDENLQRLVGLAIDNWFENLNIEYDDQDENEDDQGQLQYKDNVRRELKRARGLVRKEYRLGLVAIEEGSFAANPADLFFFLNDNKQNMLPHDRDEAIMNAVMRMRKIKEQLCTWAYEKFSASQGHVFNFDEDCNVKGPEKDPFFPNGAHIITASDAQQNRAFIESLLYGYEAAVLQDGVFYGPRFGYRLDTDPQPGQEFTFAILAVPRYPVADDLDAYVKIFMIFDYFDKNQDAVLDITEFGLWQKLLHKPQKPTWELTARYYLTHYGIQLDYNRGISLRDFQRYYQNPNELDDDYEELYPTIHDDNQRSQTSSTTTESESFNLESDDDLSEDMENDGVVNEVAMTEAQLQEQEMEEALKTNINARKLRTVFSVVTREYRGKQVDELVNSIPFLASKIVETQFRLLSPIFGRDCVLDPARINAENEPRRQNFFITTTTPEQKSEESERITQLLQMIHLDLKADLLKQCNTTFLDMFDTTIVRNGVAQFYDNIIVDKIQTKASRLLNPRLELTENDVHSLNFTEINSLPPKSAAQVIRLLNTYRVQQNNRLKESITLLSKAKTLTLNIGVILVTDALLSAQVLKKADVRSEKIEIPDIQSNGLSKSTTIEIWLPSNKECYDVIAKAVEANRSTQASSMTGGANQSTGLQLTGKNYFRIDETTTVVQTIVTRYLWFDVFVMLIRLLGINLRIDELPGAALGPTDTTFPASSQSSTLQQSDVWGGTDNDARQIEKENNRYERNMRRILEVFSQLSNSSAFLPVDLADEAILLLTDNRMHFGAVVACLQYLGIDCITAFKSEDLGLALEQLGLHSSSAAVDLEAAAETQIDEVFDWTEFRNQQNWTQELSGLFDRLTSASPGFMGKSQMIEFIKEIQKIFQPDEKGKTTISSTNRQSTDRILDIESCRMLSFQMFHRIVTKAGFSVNRHHSRIMWILMCAVGKFDTTQRFITAGTAFQRLLQFYLQPSKEDGEAKSSDETANKAFQYKGFLTQGIFRRLVRLMGVSASDKGLHGMWEALSKDPLDISDFLPALSKKDYSQTKFLRLDMDKTGMDPTRGKVISIDGVRRQLPKMLLTGLWPEAMHTLIKLSLHIDINPSLVEVVLDKFQRKANHYGLVRPEDVSGILTTLNVAGMTYPMLKEIVDKMRLNLPNSRIRQMFNLMDINHDKSLDLPELLGGFELLFGRLIPDLLFDAVGVSTQHQLVVVVSSLVGLVIFFAFIGLAFSSFVGATSNASTAMQSLLALVGAISLQSGAKQDAMKVELGMRNRMEIILGDGFDKRLKDQQEGEVALAKKNEVKRLTQQTWETAPGHICYIVPRRFRPETDDPRPCVTFYAGDFVKFVPIVTGRVDHDRLRWQITPRLPENSGLIFDTKTGIIAGVVGATDGAGVQMIVGDMLNRSTAATEEFHQHTPMNITKDPNLRQLTYDFTKENSMGSRIYVETSSFKKEKMITSSEESPKLERATGRPWTSSGEKPHILPSTIQVPSRRKFQMQRRTFCVYCKNTVGVGRTRVTFQILPETRKTYNLRRMQPGGERPMYSHTNVTGSIHSNTTKADTSSSTKKEGLLLAENNSKMENIPSHNAAMPPNTEKFLALEKIQQNPRTLSNNFTDFLNNDDESDDEEYDYPYE